MKMKRRRTTKIRRVLEVPRSIKGPSLPTGGNKIGGRKRGGKRRAGLTAPSIKKEERGGALLLREEVSDE